MNNYFPDPNIPNLLNAPGFDAALVAFKGFSFGLEARLNFEKFEKRITF